MSGGKFASGADFSGGRFLSFRGALFFPQGGAYFFSGGPFFPDEKRTAKFRGASAPLNEKCMPRDILMQDQFVQWPVPKKDYFRFGLWGISRYNTDIVYNF